MKKFGSPLKILFIPLTNTDCDNPSDRRRIFIPANYLRQCGLDVAIVNKDDALNIPADIIYSQNRDYEFWINNINKLINDQKHLVFSFSDALGIKSPSKTHDFEAFLGRKHLTTDRSVYKNLKLFIETCCSHVFAGSEFQKDILSQISSHAAISILYDPIDREIYNLDLINKESCKKDKKFTLIWEGFYDNVPYLLICADSIKRLSQKIPLRVIIATSKKRRNNFLGTADNEELARKILGDIIEFHVWDKGEISNLMAQSDVGLAPVFMDCEFAKAKPPNKAIIYNYMKLPVIASPTMEYKSYIRNGYNGFIANDPKDWGKYLELLYQDHPLMEKMGEYGRRETSKYSVETLGKQMLNIFFYLRDTPRNTICFNKNLHNLKCVIHSLSPIINIIKNIKNKHRT